MRYSEMAAFEKERRAEVARGAVPPRVLATGSGLPWWPIAVLVIAAVLLVACATTTYRDQSAPMQTAGPVDLNRYQGLWYEIARFPNRFEEGCAGVTAEYQLNEDGSVRVLNTCRQGALDGPTEVAEGIATSVSPQNDKLQVTFVPWLPFAKGDYWILDIDESYSVVVIGTPSGSVGWILARTPSLSDETLRDALSVLMRNGYDISRLTYTEH